MSHQDECLVSEPQNWEKQITFTAPSYLPGLFSKGMEELTVSHHYSLAAFSMSIGLEKILAEHLPLEHCPRHEVAGAKTAPMLWGN